MHLLNSPIRSVGADATRRTAADITGPRKRTGVCKTWSVASLTERHEAGSPPPAGFIGVLLYLIAGRESLERLNRALSR